MEGDFEELDFRIYRQSWFSSYHIISL